MENKGKGTRRRGSMVYTPKLCIPVGEASVSDKGIYVLRVKKSDNPRVDEISVDELIRQIVLKGEKKED